MSTWYPQYLEDLANPNGSSYSGRGDGQHHWLVGALRGSHAL